MWLGDSAYKQPQKTSLMFQRLRQMGINTAMIYDDSSLETRNNIKRIKRLQGCRAFCLN
jgi:hypothetical protein